MTKAASLVTERYHGPIVVLIVDDEPDLPELVAQRFRKQIRAGTHVFYFANDGEQAVAVLAREPSIEVVVSDINMPHMDGMALLATCAEFFPTVRTVIVSAYDDMSNIRAAMNRGAYDFLVKPLDFQDFERTIERTVEQVRTVRHAAAERQASLILRQFVGEGAVNYARSRVGGAVPLSNEMVDRTVVFVDICSFTSLSERHEPRVVLQLLNSYFDAIVSCIVMQGGHIDKFIGDAVMSTFQGPDAPTAAAMAVLQARQAIRRMRGDIETRIGFFPNISAGIHAGKVIAGPVGASVVGRLDFTVIGDVVNTAARLQRLAGPGEIVVTQEVRDRLDPSVLVASHGIHTLRGKTEPMALYSVRTIEGATQSMAVEPVDV